VFGRLDSTNIQQFKTANYDWITLVPWGDQKDFDSAEVRYYRGDSVEMAKRDSSWKSQIGIAHAQGFKVFLKPHVWIYKPTDGKWRAEIFPKNEANWATWQKTYREFILLYAKLAQESNVDMFCVGVEFTRLSAEKPKFWRSLISEVRAIYSGPITYAANWYQEYEQVSFWEELDYIGVQAYFPIAQSERPSLAQVTKGWQKHLPSLEAVHKQYDKPILFTEMGYKSTMDSAVEPWKWVEYTDEAQESLCNDTQANCYQAFFDTVWQQDWFAGVHVWQVRSDYQKVREHNLDFTPQGKPAAEVIRKGFE